MNAMTPSALQGIALDPGHAADLGAFGAISVRLSVEVGAIKMCLRDVLALQVGAVQLHVDGDRQHAADAFDDPGFERVQQFRLHRHRHVAEFIEKQGDAMRRFETAVA
jgi:hypothetical protein